MKKIKIPTIVGLLVLVVSLSIGLLLFSQGTGIFSPRADEASIPQNVKVTNITDKSFTVTFYTQKANTSFIKYGTANTDLKLQASDDRDQLSGSTGEFNLHHVTVRDLTANTNYYFVLANGDSSTVFDNQGSSFTVKTAKKQASSSSSSETVYGTVKNSQGVAAEGSIVYLNIEGAGEMSSLVKSSGSWAISLSNVVSQDGNSYIEVNKETILSIFVQGTPLDQTINQTVSLLNAQPVEELIFGSSNLAANPFPVEDEFNLDQDFETSTVSAVVNTEGSSSATVKEESDSTVGGVGGLAELIQPETIDSTASAQLDLTAEAIEPVITNSQPIITGKAAPNTQIKVEIHSDTQLSQTTTSDANGNFVIDTSDLTQGLEPGEHTVTYSYIDPDTGKEVVTTETFIVEDTSIVAEASTNSSQTTVPYGSGNPYSPTPTPTKTASSSSTTSTKSANVSTTSGMYVSGSVGTTAALVLGGLFFILTGAWSYWVASQLRED